MESLEVVLLPWTCETKKNWKQATQLLVFSVEADVVKHIMMPITIRTIWAVVSVVYLVGGRQWKRSVACACLEMFIRQAPVVFSLTSDQNSRDDVGVVLRASNTCSINWPRPESNNKSQEGSHLAYRYAILKEVFNIMQHSKSSGFHNNALYYYRY